MYPEGRRAMQIFTVEVQVTVNTVNPISEEDVKEEIQHLLEDFVGGNAEIVSINEVP